MSSNHLAIDAKGVGKSYTIVHDQVKHTTLAAAMFHRLKHPFHRLERETFWALKDLDFEIEKGEVVGLIGRNGAGKSTLLKVLSRITSPTEGKIDLYGRVGSLLEVGTGFHPELTGKENIFLNGAILGMTRAEVKSEFDAIVEFSGVEKFLDTPVKRYSSGMYVRLAFAVAAHLRTEILLIDEVLAVGDVEFQRKCLGKMQDVAKSGRTVVFVSHNMQSVQALCDRAIYMEQGQLCFQGDVPSAIEHYLASFEKQEITQSIAERRPGTGEFRFSSVKPVKEIYGCGDEKVIEFSIDRKKPFDGQYFVSLMVVDDKGLPILHCDSRMVGHWIVAGDKHEGRFSLKTPWLKPGRYRVDMFICSAGILDGYEGACTLEVSPLLPYEAAGNDEATAHGIVFADYGYEGCEVVCESRSCD